MFKIALDAGHGMSTPGKRCLKSIDANETREWYLNDRICDRIEKKLTAYEGYEVLRVDDTTGVVDIPLSQRTSKANKWGADIYLSVHANAGVAGGTGGGIISIAHTKASQKSLEYQGIIYNELIKETGLVGNRSIPCPKQNLQVLRESNMPAVLVECGFMDSKIDVPIILTEEFADQSATALTNALVLIGGLKIKNKAENQRNDEGLTMAQYEELKKEIEALKAKNQALESAIGRVYKTEEEIPNYYMSILKPLIDKGAIKGVGENNLNLPEIMARTLVIIMRDKNT